MDAGTLYHLRNTVHRTNVTSLFSSSVIYYAYIIMDGNIDGVYTYREPHSCTHSICLLIAFAGSPKDSFNECEDFFFTTIHAHIVAASMQILGMTSVHDSPTMYVLPDDMTTLTKAQKRGLLLTPAGDILSAFFRLGFTSSKQYSVYLMYHIYINAYTANLWSICTCMILFSNVISGPASSDGIMEYGKEVFSLGMLYMEFHDAIKEGDGLRVLRCWKYLLLIFKASQRKNYSIEAFNLLCQYFYYLSPQMCQQLLYSRFINMQRRIGCNMPCDLHMEHLNRVVKETIQHLGANKTEGAIVRSSKCSQLLTNMLKNLDKITGLKEISGAHARASEKSDVEQMVSVLSSNAVFCKVGNRSHGNFKNFKSNNLIRSLDATKLKEWMEEQFQPSSF